MTSLNTTQKGRLNDLLRNGTEAEIASFIDLLAPKLKLEANKIVASYRTSTGVRSPDTKVAIKGKKSSAEAADLLVNFTDVSGVVMRDVMPKLAKPLKDDGTPVAFDLDVTVLQNLKTAFMFKGYSKGAIWAAVKEKQEELGAEFALAMTTILTWYAVRGVKFDEKTVSKSESSYAAVVAFRKLGLKTGRVSSLKSSDLTIQRLVALYGSEVVIIRETISTAPVGGLYFDSKTSAEGKDPVLCSPEAPYVLDDDALDLWKSWGEAHTQLISGSTLHLNEKIMKQKQTDTKASAEKIRAYSAKMKSLDGANIVKI